MTPAQSFDLLRMTLCIICTYFLTYIDGIAIYDFIRSQSVIKLYVVFNSMEVSMDVALKLTSFLIFTSRSSISWLHRSDRIYSTRCGYY
jgi:hypothetical protein